MTKKNKKQQQSKTRAPQCSPANFLAAGIWEHGPIYFFAQMPSTGLRNGTWVSLRLRVVQVSLQRYSDTEKVDPVAGRGRAALWHREVKGRKILKTYVSVLTEKHVQQHRQQSGRRVEEVMSPPSYDMLLSGSFKYRSVSFRETWWSDQSDNTNRNV